MVVVMSGCLNSYSPVMAIDGKKRLFGLGLMVIFGLCRIDSPDSFRKSKKELMGL